uniref:Homeobox domain-containing protein n=1 Tax=Molossus molossus TaxID=27622 RepID=A0A7J8J7S5_MOLMO|nr:hypothetical protein HJG59_009609 [Molossus molossus]KAF6492410.1 hypothetical protein HJG59_009614 [Molossus molossus]
MKAQDQHSQDAAGFLSLGVEEDGGELREVTSAGILLIGEGEEEKGTQPEPEQGAASAEGKEVGAEEEAKEGSHGGPGGLGTPGPMYDEYQEGSGDSDEEPVEQEQEEQLLLADVQHPLPGDQQQLAQRTMFTEVQMQELEHIFQHNPYPGFLLRQDIARRMNVPEARVQVSKPE